VFPDASRPESHSRWYEWSYITDTNGHHDAMTRVHTPHPSWVESQLNIYTLPLTVRLQWTGDKLSSSLLSSYSIICCKADTRDAQHPDYGDSGPLWPFTAFRFIFTLSSDSTVARHLYKRRKTLTCSYIGNEYCGTRHIPRRNQIQLLIYVRASCLQVQWTGDKSSSSLLSTYSIICCKADTQAYRHSTTATAVVAAPAISCISHPPTSAQGRLLNIYPRGYVRLRSLCTLVDTDCCESVPLRRAVSGVTAAHDPGVWHHQ
jgi:hypothetical protein